MSEPMNTTPWSWLWNRTSRTPPSISKELMTPLRTCSSREEANWEIRSRNSNNSKEQTDKSWTKSPLPDNNNTKLSKLNRKSTPVPPKLLMMLSLFCPVWPTPHWPKSRDSTTASGKSKPESSPTLSTALWSRLWSCLPQNRTSLTRTPSEKSSTNWTNSELLSSMPSTTQLPLKPRTLLNLRRELPNWMPNSLNSREESLSPPLIWMPPKIKSTSTPSSSPRERLTEKRSPLNST